MHEMKELLSLANKHCNSKMAPCTILYRNKSKEYFDDILTRNNGIMKLNLKDGGGSPKSPINGRLGGVFFTASLTKISPDVDPLSSPPHGSSRFQVYIENLIKPSNHNLYFADFFCVGSECHYVILVVCEIGSNADHFCERHLPELDWDENNFITCSDGVTFKIVSKEHCIIDLFYANTINIKKLLNSKKASLVRDLLKHEKGCAIYEGVKKHPHCKICNIHKPSLHIVTPDYYNNNDSSNDNNNNNHNNSPKPRNERHATMESEKYHFNELTETLPSDIRQSETGCNKDTSPTQVITSSDGQCNGQTQLTDALPYNGQNNNQKKGCGYENVNSSAGNMNEKPPLANSRSRYSGWACCLI